jgi:hypothetical protein
VSDQKPRTEARLTRRAVLAAIALAPAPTPDNVHLGDPDGGEAATSISLGLGNDMGGFRAWCSLLGAEDEDVRHQAYDRDGLTGELWNATVEGAWGWSYVHISGFDPIPPVAADEPLPAETVTALSEITAEREAGQ